MKQLTKRLIQVFVLVLLLALAVYYVKNNFSSFKEIKVVSPLLIIPLVLLFLVATVFNGLLNRSLISAVGPLISIKESFALAIITGFYNMITPFRGGMAARALYLKKKYDFAYTHFFSTLSAIYVLIFFISSFLGLLSLLWMYYYSKTLSVIFFLLLLGIFILMLLVIIISPEFKERKNKWVNRVINVINGWHAIKKNKKILLITLVFTLVQVLVSSIFISFLFLAFSVHISFSAAVFLSVITSLGIIIAITPGNLGVQEAITVFSATTIGITPVESLAAALLGRFISVIVLFILGPIFSYILLRRVDEQTKKEKV